MLQYQPDLCGVAVARPRDVETTAAGAAIAAGLGAGVWKDVADLPTSTEDIDRRFEPEITLAERLRDVGYSCHILGKWHLGHHRAAALPHTDCVTVTAPPP